MEGYEEGGVVWEFLNAGIPSPVQRVDFLSGDS